METDKITLESINQIVSDLESRILDIENRQEESELYYQATKHTQRSIEEIIEIACVSHFEVSRKDFHEKDYSRLGNPKLSDSDTQNVVLARQWFMSIMTNVLHKSSYSMSKNYEFYHYKKMADFRKTFLSALNPKNEEQKKIRNSYLAIMDSIKRIMKEENVEDENFN